MERNFLSITEIAEKYGIPSSTINHYTNIGLLTVEGRKKNMRLYDEVKVKKRLARITKFRHEGYPLHLIHKELDKV